MSWEERGEKNSESSREIGSILSIYVATFFCYQCRHTGPFADRGRVHKNVCQMNQVTVIKLTTSLCVAGARNQAMRSIPAKSFLFPMFLTSPEYLSYFSVSLWRELWQDYFTDESMGKYIPHQIVKKKHLPILSGFQLCFLLDIQSLRKLIVITLYFASCCPLFKMAVFIMKRSITPSTLCLHITTYCLHLWWQR